MEIGPDQTVTVEPPLHVIRAGAIEHLPDSGQQGQRIVDDEQSTVIGKACAALPTGAIDKLQARPLHRRTGQYAAPLQQKRDAGLRIIRASPGRNSLATVRL